MEGKEGQLEKLVVENLILKRQIDELNKTMVEKDEKFEILLEGNSMLESKIDELNILLKQKDKIMIVLANELEVKSMNFKELGRKYKDTSLSLEKSMDQSKEHQQTYDEEIRRFQQNAKDHFQRITSEHEKLKLELQSQREEPELCGKELEKRDAQIENERDKLNEEKKKNAMENSSLEMAGLEQKMVVDYVLLLKEDQKREKEALRDRIIQLEKQLDGKQALELEIEQLKGNLNFLKHNICDEDLESLSQALKQHETFDELQDARKELIKSIEICTSWEELLRNPDWQPFKIIKEWGSSIRSASDNNR